MQYVSEIDRMESIRSFQSTISKSDNALAQMTQKGANTTLIKKRLKALYIGLAILENAWNQRNHDYNQEDIEDARIVLEGLLPSVRASFAKAKEGSPQRTLLERRIKSLEFAIQAMDEFTPL